VKARNSATGHRLTVTLGDSQSAAVTYLAASPSHGLNVINQQRISNSAAVLLVLQLHPTTSAVLDCLRRVLHSTIISTCPTAPGGQLPCWLPHSIVASADIEDQPMQGIALRQVSLCLLRFLTGFFQLLQFRTPLPQYQHRLSQHGGYRCMFPFVTSTC
jgi:hypothetical protein